MRPRTEDLQAVISNTTDDLEIFQRLADQYTLNTTDVAAVLTSDEKYNVALYVAAHYWQVSNPLAIKSRYAEGSEELETAEAGSGFAETRFGRMALTLDRSKTLEIAGAKIARMEWF